MGLERTFSDVLEALSELRLESQELIDDWDWNTEPTIETFREFNVARTSALQVIERSRNKTGDDFAEAARNIVRHWSEHISILEKREYDRDDPQPAIETLMYFLARGMPKPVRELLMPAFSPAEFWLQSTRASLENAEGNAFVVRREDEEFAEMAISKGILRGYRIGGRLHVSLNNAL